MELSVNNRNKEELKNVLTAISQMSAMKAQSIRELTSEGIEITKAQKIFNDKTYEGILDNDNDIYILFKVLYQISKEELLNPLKMKFAESPFEDGDEYKDNLPSLYYDYEYKKAYTTEKYSEKTQRVVMALFRRTAETERLLNKDLYDFEISELEELLRKLNIKTYRSMQNTISKIEIYIKKSIKLNKTKYKANSAEAFNSKPILEGLLYEANMIFDKEDIMHMAEESDNAQDGVILGLIFDGVDFRHEFSEMINLKQDCVDFESKTISLPSREIEINGKVTVFPSRVIEMSESTLRLVRDAINIDEYYSVNGQSVREYKIADGDRVIRGVRGKNIVKPQIISQRLLRVAKLNGYEDFNATTISNSGQIHLSRELLKSGKSIDETVEIVLHRFGVAVNTSSRFYLKTKLYRELNIEISE